MGPLKNLFLLFVVIAIPRTVLSQSMEILTEIRGKDTVYIEKPVTGKGYTYIDSISKPYPTYDVLKFFRSNFKMPATWKTQNIQENVVVSFAIDKSGNISDPIVHSNTSAIVDAEIKRVFKMLPQWVPAKKGNVTYGQTSRLEIPVSY